MPSPRKGLSPNPELSLDGKLADTLPEENIDDITYNDVAQIYEVPHDVSCHYENDNLYKNSNFGIYENNDSAFLPSEYEVPVAEGGSRSNEVAARSIEAQEHTYRNLEAGSVHT